MDAQLKASLEKLAKALHRAIEESPDVDRALAELRAHGLAAVLLLEVTVALTRTDGAETDEPERSGDEWLEHLPGGEPAASDRDFLKSLRIRLD